MRIAVFNTFDITPGENGGEVRLLNVYRRLSRTDEVRVVSYDLRCKVPVRRETVSPALDIVDTMVTDADRWAFFQANERLGLYPHDVLCIDTYAFSPHFLREAQWALDWAEVVVVEHPFLATEIFGRCGSRQLRVFGSHNIELRAKNSFFAPAKDRALADSFIAATRRCEAHALEAADIALTVSGDDSQGFIEEYGVDAAKLHVVPNGVTVADYDAVGSDAVAAFRREAGLTDADVGIFLGSAYGPNVDSYRIARAWLDEAGFRGTMFVVGRIADVHDDSWPKVGFTEQWLGFVDNASKHLLVKSADFAIHIVTSGGGTNLKLFDYMAAGIPILTTGFGRRGVSGDEWFIPVDTAAGMRDVVAARGWRGPAARQSADNARLIALRDFDWDSIVKRYRDILA